MGGSERNGNPLSPRRGLKFTAACKPGACAPGYVLAPPPGASERFTPKGRLHGDSAFLPPYLDSLGNLRYIT